MTYVRPFTDRILDLVLKENVFGGSLDSPKWLLLAHCPKILGVGSKLQIVFLLKMNVASVVWTIKGGRGYSNPISW